MELALLHEPHYPPSGQLSTALGTPNPHSPVRLTGSEWWTVVHLVRYPDPMKEPPRDRHIPDLVSLKEAADILKVVRQYAHRLADRGQLVGAKVGGTWVFRRVVVERLRDQRGSDS